MLRVLVPSAAVLALALPGAALAADPIPGATYEGTTDTGSPFSFKVSPDGKAVTDILGSAPLSCVGPEGGVEIYALASTVPMPIAGGAFSGKDETTTPRLDAVSGTFTSPSEASGTIQAATSKFKIGEGVTSCMREVRFTARTSAAAPAAPSAPAPTSGLPAPPMAPATFTGKASAKLLDALGKGLAVRGTVPAPAKVAATASISRADARRYGLGRAAKVVARRTANVGAGAFALTLKPGGRDARKLRKARRLKLAVTLVTTPAGGAPTTARRTYTLTR